MAITTSLANRSAPPTRPSTCSVRWVCASTADKMVPPPGTASASTLPTRKALPRSSDERWRRMDFSLARKYVPKAASQRYSSRVRASSMALPGILLRRPSWRRKLPGSSSKALAITVPAQPVWVLTFTVCPPSSVRLMVWSWLASSRAWCITDQKAWSSTDIVEPPRSSAVSSNFCPGAGRARWFTASTRAPSFSSSGAASSSQATRQCSSMPVACLNNSWCLPDRPLRTVRVLHSTKGSISVVSSHSGSAPQATWMAASRNAISCLSPSLKRWRSNSSLNSPACSGPMARAALSASKAGAAARRQLGRWMRTCHGTTALAAPPGWMKRPQYAWPVPGSGWRQQAMLAALSP
ncbi:hypothetical protein [Aquabacterium sp. OR-4]|uniref:hypothetical protein n=1 Tax=Aquabacterium sp. OR-4 TaxID=2978127 RepID=UPI0028C6EF36|nr:hypothetical protein [Aquabacterium sp. OR-4]MDT7836618.1 hypothetical protein [Aquabacterium sp. OR-4]